MTILSYPVLSISPTFIQMFEFWLYLVASVLITFSVINLLPNQTRFLVACSGLIIIAWIGGRNLWFVLSSFDYGGVLTNFGKGITVGSALLMIAFDRKRWIYILACVCIGIFFIIGGIQHFIFIDFVKMLVPRWIPGDMFWSYVSGVGLIAAGVALITGIKRKLAALVSAGMVFIWFLILHIPRAVEFSNLNEWTAVFQALSVAGILVVIYHKY